MFSVRTEISLSAAGAGPLLIPLTPLWYGVLLWVLRSDRPWISRAGRNARSGEMSAMQQPDSQINSITPYTSEFAQISLT